MENNNYNAAPELTPNEQENRVPVENLILDPYCNQAEIEQAKEEVTAQAPIVEEQAVAPQEEPIYQQPQYTQPLVGAPMNMPQQKSKIAAGLLGIFLGAFGVHNFYLGYNKKAIIQLLITVLSCFTLSVVSEIWGLVEGIQVLTGSIAVDANGIPLKD